MIKKIYKSILSERLRVTILHTIFKIRSILYIGTKYHCNCCNKSFRKFLTYGTDKRKNVACPYCNSLERNRVMQFFLERETDIFKKEQSLLHFAPERLLEKQFKNTKTLNYISADINSQLADIIVDITNIQFNDNYFDKIICSHVLAHIDDEKKAINELHRVLKPDGSAIILTRIEKTLNTTYEVAGVKTVEDRIKYYKQDDLARIHGTDFHKRLEKEGFKVEIIDYAASLGKDINTKYSLGNGEREIIYLCHK